MTIASDKSVLEILNRLFAEATRARGDDPLGVVDRFEALVEALSPDDRVAVRAALARMTSTSAGGLRGETRH